MPKGEPMDRFGQKFFISTCVTVLSLYLFDMGVAGTIFTFASTFVMV
jgi:hypothetical protein